MRDFAYHAPASLEEAIELKTKQDSASRFLSGGTDLFLAMEWGAAEIKTVIDLKSIPELNGLEQLAGGGYRIGALTPMATIEKDEGLRRVFPSLCAAAEVVGGPSTRNRATLGGNLCNASPAADTATPLLVLGAEVVAAGAGGERTFPLAELWSGPRANTLQPGELLKEVRLPAPRERSGCAFERLTRTAMDIAVVNAAAAVSLDAEGRFAHVALALGAVAPTVLAVPNLTRALVGKAPGKDVLEQVRALAEGAAQPIDDRRASAAYRREMAGLLAVRAVRRALDLAGGQDSALAGGESTEMAGGKGSREGGLT